MRAAFALSLLLLFACKPSERPAAAEAPSAAPGSTDSKALLAQVDRLKDQLKDRPKSFEVVSALGNLYYENGRYLEAVDSFREALALSSSAEAQREALRSRRVEPAGELAPECRRAGLEYGLAQISEAAKKLDAPRQRRCLDSALEMAIAARARRGNALFLIGHPDGALAEHRTVLERSPDYPESLFFVGAILLEQGQGEKEKLAEGKKYWKRLIQVAPDHPRAALVRESLPKADELFAKRAGGGLPAGHPPVDPAQGELPPGHPPVSGNQPGAPMAHAGGAGPQVDPETVRNLAEAARNMERTPELEKGLDDLTREADRLLDQGKYQEARDTMVRVMPMRPDDAHTAANLGAAMRGLGRTEMAERTLQRALQLDPRQPRALYEMGRLLAARGDKRGAARRFEALRAADPQFAKAHNLDAELQRLR